MVANNIHTPKLETKLAYSLDTCGEFMLFTSYFLWFLLDLGLVIIGIKCMVTWTANCAFRLFVTDQMQKHIDILCDKTEGNEKFNKISLNRGYGYDGMNTEKFPKIKVCDEN